MCADEGVISNWEGSPYDLRRRRLTAVGTVNEINITDEVATALRELMLLDPDCERLVFSMHAHHGGAVLHASEGDLEELIGGVAAEANHETNRRRQRRLDSAFIERRAPWREDFGPEWSSVPIARLRYTAATKSWTLYWRDRNLRFHLYDLVTPSPHVEDLLAEIDRDSTGIFWG